MALSDEQFFEELAEGSNEGTNYHVAVTKSEGGKAKVSRRSSDDNFDAEPEGQLTLDVYQTPNEIVVESAVAGVDPEDLDINVTTDSITIRGRRQRNKVIKEEDYFYRECYWGRFARSVILPQEVDPENASVNFKNGILTVHLPKMSRRKTKKLKVELE